MTTAQQVDAAVRRILPTFEAVARRFASASNVESMSMVTNDDDGRPAIVVEFARDGSACWIGVVR